MPGIYEIFATAAATVKTVPWRWRILSGAGVGAVAGAATGDPNEDLLSRIGKGMVLGTVAGVGAEAAIRGAGRGVEFAGRRFGGYFGRRNEVFSAAKKTMGMVPAARKAFLTPLTLGLVGAGVGAAVAPPGSTMMGAVLGGAAGAAIMPAKGLWTGYERLGKIPGAQTAALLSAAVPVAMYGAFRDVGQQAGIAGVEGPEGPIYQPMSSGVADRVAAMSASGEIVLGLNNRRRG
jgi:hypothetical protein